MIANAFLSPTASSIKEGPSTANANITSSNGTNTDATNPTA